MKLSTNILLGLLSGVVTAAKAPAPHVTNPLSCSPQNPDCVRGAAEPVLRKSVYPKARFQLQPDKLTGIETLGFANGDRLTIKNWGCEYYTLTFRFETTRFQQDTTARAQWYRHSVTLLTELLPGLAAPLDIKDGVAALRRYVDQGNVGPRSEEIYYGRPGNVEFVAVDKIQKLAGRKYAVEVTFALGL